MEASRLYTTVAVGPMPPVVEKTSGKKDPCSIGHELCVCNNCPQKWSSDVCVDKENFQAHGTKAIEKGSKQCLWAATTVGQSNG